MVALQGSWVTRVNGATGKSGNWFAWPAIGWCETELKGALSLFFQ